MFSLFPNYQQSELRIPRSRRLLFVDTDHAIQEIAQCENSPGIFYPAGSSGSDEMPDKENLYYTVPAFTCKIDNLMTDALTTGARQEHHVLFPHPMKSNCEPAIPGRESHAFIPADNNWYR